MHGVHDHLVHQPFVHLVFPAVVETIEFEVFTWFMTSQHYIELRRYGLTQVFVPVFPVPYLLPIYIAIHYPNSWFEYCQVKFPGMMEWTHIKNMNHGRQRQPSITDFTRFVIRVNASVTSSGEYSVRCRARTTYTPDWGHAVIETRFYESQTWTYRTLNLTFFRGKPLAVCLW